MSRRGEKYKKYLERGLALVIGTAGFLASFLWPDRLRIALSPATVQGRLGIGVVLASIFWFVAFMWATDDEMELFEEHEIAGRVSVEDWKVFLLVVSGSLAIGALIATAIFPITYCIIASAIQFADCIGLWMIQRALFEADQRQHQEFNPVLYGYYLDTPHFVHRTAKLVGFMSALVFAVAAQFSQRAVYSTLSSVLIIATIAIGETVLIIWRVRLKQKLLELREQSVTP